MITPATHAPQASSEALFGSTARGDADALSDRDVLVVDDDPQRLAARSAELRAQGASVASYTFAKLAALADMGALFLQHLKLEALISHDENGRLSRLLDGFQPRTDYSAEIAENTKLSALAGTMPAGSRGLLLAADILYVSVRNHGVLSLAELGVHVYSFDAVASGLEAAGLIAPGGARSLGALRFLKCLYRNGETSRGEATKTAVEAALSVLPADRFPRRVRAAAPREIATMDAPIDASAYVALRDLERRLVALDVLDHDAVLDQELARLRRWIVNPRAYAALSRRLAPGLQALISRLADNRVAAHRATA